MKKYASLFLPFIAVFAIYSIIVFVIGNLATTQFWISFILSFLSLVAILLSLCFFSQRLNYYSKILTLTPVVIVSAIFLLIQCIISVIFISFDKVDLGLPILFELCLLIIYFIAVIFFFVYKKSVNIMIVNDSKLNNNCSFKSNLQKEVELLQSTKHSILIDNKLNQLSENIKYKAEPRSIEESAIIENNIIEKLYILKISLKENDEEKSLSTLDEIYSMLNQRNIICGNGRA